MSEWRRYDYWGSDTWHLYAPSWPTTSACGEKTPSSGYVRKTFLELSDTACPECEAAECDGDETGPHNAGPHNAEEISPVAARHMESMLLSRTGPHGEHYAGSVQPVDLIDAQGLGWDAGCVVKYICRAGRKEDAVADLEKAAWHIERMIRRAKE